MNYIPTLLAAAATMLSVQADAAAAPSSSPLGAAPGSAYVSTGGGSDVALTSSEGVPNGGIAIVATSTGDSTGDAIASGVTSINLNGAHSFRFLWSTPDKNSAITIDGTTYTGEQLFNGQTGGPVWATFTSASGMHSVSFADARGGYQIALSTSADGGTTAPNGAIAVEIPVDAVVPGATPVVGAVPEPQTYALLLAGLVTVGFVARRRRPR